MTVAGGSYRGVFAQALLYPPHGGEPIELTARDAPWVNSVSWTKEFGVMQSLSVGIDMPYREGIAALDAGWFQLGSVMDVRIGYSDTQKVTPWQRGLLKDGGTGLSITADGVSGTLAAVPFGAHRHDAGLKAIQSSVTRKRVRAILEALAEQLGAPLVVTGTAEAQLASIQGKKENPFYNGFDPAGRGALVLLQQVTQALGLAYRTERRVIPSGKGARRIGNVLVVYYPFFEESESQGTLSRYRFVMRGRFLPQENQWPMLEFSPELDPAVFMWAGEDVRHRGVSTGTVDPETGEIVTAVSRPDQERNAKALAVSSGRDKRHRVTQDKVDAKVRGAAVHVAGGTQQAVDAAAAAAMPVISATISTFGIPDDMAGKVVEVRGCSTRLDMLYRVEKETQEWSPGSWTTALTVRTSAKIDSQEG